MPTRGGRHPVPSGVFTTRPPVWQSPGGGCHTGILAPMDGYILEPGDPARVWTEIRGRTEGSYRVTGQVVTYLQNGEAFHQVLPIAYQGQVTRSAQVAPDRTEEPCLYLADQLSPTEPHGDAAASA